MKGDAVAQRLGLEVAMVGDHGDDLRVELAAEVAAREPRGLVARRRFEYRYRNVPVVDLRVQAEGHPAVALDGIVDSGATHTILSIQTEPHRLLHHYRPTAPGSRLAPQANHALRPTSASVKTRSPKVAESGYATTANPPHRDRQSPQGPSD